jgi:hypothetical protein
MAEAPTVMSIAWTWGTESAERALVFPCDAHLRDASAQYFRGISVRAAPAVLFHWLCQLRVAPYSYDWIDNGGRRSPRTPTPGMEQLSLGQSVMRRQLLNLKTHAERQATRPCPAADPKPPPARRAR